ncbi:hypothetical protein ACSQ67_008715 [Phaseolus vulgaris]
MTPSTPSTWGRKSEEDAIDTEAATDEGVIHWAIGKSSFMDDDDEGPFVGSEDVDMTVFGSNDMAVEEKMNSKVLQVKSVKDVLLLKGMGRRVSPLREGPKIGSFTEKLWRIRNNMLLGIR